MKKLAAGLVILSLSSAALPAAAQDSQKRYPKAWKQISGLVSGIENFEAAFIENEAAWQSLWKRHAKGAAKKAMPGVDFKKERLVAVFLGTRRTAGYRVALTVFSFPNKPEEVLVIYKEIKPEPRGFKAEMISHPFVIRKVSKSFKTACFEKDRHYSYPKPLKPGKAEVGEVRILPISTVLEKMKRVDGEVRAFRILSEGRGL